MSLDKKLSTNLKMKLDAVQALTFLTLLTTWSALAASVPPLAAEASLTDSVRSFESAISDIDDKIQAAAREEKVLTKQEKWTAGAVAGLTLLGTGGFIVSSAIPIAKKRQRAAALKQLQQAVADANGRKEELGFKAKRSAEEQIVKTASELAMGREEAHIESFRSAASHTSSEGLEDFDDGRHLSRSPSLERHAQRESWRNDVEDQLSTLASAVLDLKQHQHDQIKTLSPFAKTMIGVGVVNAVAGIASAELSAQNAIENAHTQPDLPDVSNLDQQMCSRFAAKIPGLDCDKARSGASESNGTAKSV